MGKLDHHGKNELFRSDIISMIPIENIKQKVEVVKMKDYCEKKFNDKIYVYRQAIINQSILQQGGQEPAARTSRHVCVQEGGQPR